MSASPRFSGAINFLDDPR